MAETVIHIIQLSRLGKNGHIFYITIVVFGNRPCLSLTVYTLFTGLDADVSLSLLCSIFRASNYLAGFLVFLKFSLE